MQILCGGEFMTKLNKNFCEKKRTIEAMINACGGINKNCMCDSMIDCACGFEQHKLQSSKYKVQLGYHKSGFHDAAN